MDKTNFTQNELQEMESVEVHEDVSAKVNSQNQCSNEANGCGGGVDQQQCTNKVTGCGVVVNPQNCEA